MQISLHSILIHEYFDWTCWRSRAALLENMEVVVKAIAIIETVTMDSSSSLYKTMVKLYDLLKRLKMRAKALKGFSTKKIKYRLF